MLFHATTVAIDKKAVLISGPPGSGKSDLALRLIDRGAVLVSDDQTELNVEGRGLFASPPEKIAGILEIRHLGLFRVPFLSEAEVSLLVELCPIDEALPRLPEYDAFFLFDCPLRKLRLPAFYPSTAAKIRAALAFEYSDG